MTRKQQYILGRRHISVVLAVVLAVATLLSGIAGATTTKTVAPTTSTFTLKQTNNTTTSITMTWTDSRTIAGTAGYTVFRNGVNIAQKLTVKTYTDKSLKPGAKYSYAVKAVGTNGISLRSTSVLVMTTRSLPDTIAPTVPQGLTALAVGEQTIALKWNAATDNVKVNGYDVFRNGVRLVSVPANVLQYGDKGLESGKTYNYAVRAIDSAKNMSALSKPLVVTTKKIIVIPDPPTNPYKSKFKQVFVRGTFNNFAKDTYMTPVADNEWRVELTFVGKANNRFKFDVEGDWQNSFGDSDGDMVAEGGDVPAISVTEGPGVYVVTFNDSTLEYNVAWKTTAGTGGADHDATVSFDYPTYRLQINEIDYLQANVGGMVQTPKLVWASSDESVLSVMGGTIRALKPGKAFVRVGLTNDPTVFDVCEVTVTAATNRHPVFDNPELNYVFDLSALPTLTVEISTAEWNALLKNFDTNPKNEIEVAADFTFNKNGKIDKLGQIGIRLRGNTSRVRPEGAKKGELHNPLKPNWNHAHFALKFNKFVPGQRFYGMTDLNTKWFKDDASYVREVYSYDLLRRFNVWTTPVSSYARLFIKIKEDAKPAYYGIYQMVESINQDFLNKRFPKTAAGKADGNLWKGTYPNTGPADLTTKNLSTRIGIEDPDNNIFKSYDLKTNKKTIDTMARPQLEQFIKTLSSSEANKAWLEQNMNVDLFLRTLAGNVALGSWDDYWVLGNNYYMYFDLDGKMQWIPYDYDNTLGTSLMMSDSGKQNVMRWGKFDKSRPLIFRVLSVPEYSAKYLNYLNELLDEQKNLLDEKKSVARIKAWQQLIAAHVANDTGEDMVIADRPASWGNASFYRLLSGDESTNFFKAKANAIRQAQP
jgi:spore coat protein H